MAKPRSRVHHGAKTQVRRDALLHSRSRWLYYRSWAKQSGHHLRLRGATQANGSRRESHEVRKERYQPGSRAERAASTAQGRADGGFISADARHAVTSAAAIDHQVSMHRNISPLRVTR